MLLVLGGDLAICLQKIAANTDIHSVTALLKRLGKVKAIIKQLTTQGWRQARNKGSHHQFQHPHKPGTVTVAGKLRMDHPPGTLKSIQKQAGLE
jgi:predicted RNA binding protein YcfA (HicA-like mRNA interferase family)